MIKTYLKEIADVTSRGDAREESYYAALRSFIENYAHENGHKKTDITILPKKTEAGNPDFRVWDGKQHITGYIEAKTPGTNLNHIEDTEQLTRYLNTFPNLILTDFYEFRLYRDGELIDSVSIGRPVIAKKLKTTPPVENQNDFYDLVERFLSFALPRKYSASSLATELAKRTRFLKDAIITEELVEEENGKGAILGFYEAFQKYLVPNLTKEDFADLYAQTITYGLFAARTRADNEFNREIAYKFIPTTIGILRDVFQFISFGEVPLQMKVTIEDITEVLFVADINKILHQFFSEGKGNDPIIHFYETFLSVYAPQVREQRGVYYTPEPVVKYIVRAINSILKSHFDLPDGLADENVKLLDPAGGTLTFPAEAIRLASEEYKEKYGTGGLKNWIKNHILKNYFAFELMMAPYAIGHLKMGFIFDELGYRLEENERFQLYLTNTLDMENVEEMNLPFYNSLSEENRHAKEIKDKEPILVVLGNPPYSGVSANINEWTEKLLKQDVDGAQSYYKVDDKPLNEKKLWLQDDYVKFLRFSQWKIQKSRHGIVGMITNHSYLDNPTFRGMRQSLMKTFDEIYIIDLHGNSLKKETAPDGSKDENVFDIRQGVAIVLFIKNKAPKSPEVYHIDKYGLRNDKYDWLENLQFDKENYDKIAPASPWYFLIPRNTENIKHYLKWISVNSILPVNVSGIVTARDKFVIDFKVKELKYRIAQFKNTQISDAIIKSTYKLIDTRGWNCQNARIEIASDNNWDSYFEKILYRPFDVRYIYYNSKMVDWGRPKFMRHMLQDNIGLTIGRQGKVVGDSHLWNLTFVADSIIDFNLYYRGGGLLLPLYLYPDNEDLFGSGQTDRKPNISEVVYNTITELYGVKPSPEEILYYIYGVFYSNIYRETYAEYLKIDFPRVPFTNNYNLFISTGVLGKRLADIHLLNSHELDYPIAKYMGESDNDRIEKYHYDEEQKRIYINKDKYFEGIEPDVWDYQIGGYQVLNKYLKDRKKRIMDDPKTYCRIISALSITIAIQKELDEIFPDIEKSAVEF